MRSRRRRSKEEWRNRNALIDVSVFFFFL